MNIYSIPMLISTILCSLLSIITWLFRRRENINRVFSLFTLALALDSLAFFLWFQFGRVENLGTWMRIIFATGFLVPTGLIIFFLAFTGYDQQLERRVLGIKVKHFRVVSLLIVFLCMLISQFTDLIINISETPKDIWDLEFGPIGKIMFPLYAIIFIYLFTMATKSYRSAANKPQKRFILLLTVGTGMWLLFGYVGAAVLPISGEDWQAVSYMGTGVMAIFYFVAIVNYQSDKVNELNFNLERKVIERTRELNQKNTELEDTLLKLKQMQKQVIVQEKMASLGKMVAGLTHEFNTPIGAILSINDTKSKAVQKLETVLGNQDSHSTAKNSEIQKALDVIQKADQLIDQGTKRLNDIIQNLKNFARLDEADKTLTDIHKGLDSVLALIKHDLLTNIVVVREYGAIPPFVCHARKLNQVFLNLLKNACQAIEGKGQITIRTSLIKNKVHVAIRDTGKGIKPEDLESIFDPGFTTKDSVVRASLGLSICYQIMQEHHGNIHVKSQLGKGSVFTVIIPMEF